MSVSLTPFVWNHFGVQSCPHLDSSVPCMPMYGVYISQLLRFAHACDRYSDFLARRKCLVRTLLDQGFRYGLLCRKFKQFTGPTIPWSSIIPTQWRSISGRVMIVRFRDGTSAFCWLEQQWLAPTNYQFTLSLVSPWLFLPFFIFIFYFLFFIFLFFIFFISYYFSLILLFC